MAGCVLVALSLSAQNENTVSRSAILLEVGGGYQFSGGDLAFRYGNNLSVGGGLGYKMRSNWIFDIEAQFMFGSLVKNEELILGNSLTARSQILNLNGSYATLDLFQRGTYGAFNVSKILNFWKANGNSGPTIGLGAGYMVNWTEIDNPGNTAPQFANEYDKGYDQLSMGMLTKQSIGYFFLSENRRINFQLSFELLQAYTENVRNYNYFEGVAGNDQQLDLLYGLKLEWYFPIYLLKKDEQQYYYK